MIYKDTTVYYRILGISAKAGIAEIKKAYRQKAKLLHPDRNSSPTAHEDFVALTEAYEYLMQWHTTGQTTYYTETTNYYRQQEETRARAKAEAQKRYQDFINSDLYKTMQATDTVASHLYLLFSCVLLFGIPLFAAYQAGFWGLVTVGLLFIILSPLLKSTLFAAVDINPGLFVKSLLVVVKLRSVQVIALTVLNLVLFFKIALATLLPLRLTVGLFLLAIVGSLFAHRLLRPNQKSVDRYFIAGGLAPLLINLLFLINYVFAGKEYSETYNFEKYTEASSRGRTETTLIVLENNAYEHYPFIRFFFDYTELAGRDKITYTFKKGLFGIPTLKSYTCWY